MKNKVSCGFVIQVGESAPYKTLICLPTGSKNYDFPKGIRDPIDASDLVAACRELYEETGLTLSKKHLETLVDLGREGYSKEKDIHLFMVFVPAIDLSQLSCMSTFIDKKLTEQKEIRGYKLVSLEESSLMLTKSMQEYIKLKWQIIQNA